MESFWGLLHSAVMLLVLCFVYDGFGVYSIPNRNVRNGVTGVLVGLMGVAVMLSPWSLEPGVFFDTRWVVLSLSGLFFGLIPTAVAVVITGSLRLYQGGAGGVAGTVVIVVTAGVGLAWRTWAARNDKPLGWKQLYAFGVVVQLAMLSCMFLMPANLRLPILKAVAPTILTVYPVITLLIGFILKRQEDRRAAEVELIEARRALTRERGLLRGVIDSIPDLIFFKSPRGEYLGCNKAFASFVGREEQGLVGKTDVDLFGPEGAALLRDQGAKQLEGEKPTSHEDWVVSGDGKRALMNTLETPFKGLDGVLHGVVAISRDITERKQTEELIQSSRDWLQTLVDGISEQLMVINRDFSIALANKAAALMAGKTPVELIGLPCFGVSHNSQEPCRGTGHACPLQLAVETKAPVMVEHTHFDATGRARNIEMVAAPVFDAAGDVAQIIESCRDITARRAAEEAKRDLERQMQHAQKLESLGVLAGGVAHDFNNILMGVLGNAELAMRKLPPENPARDHLQRIETAAVRAADLAKQMLAYSGKGQFVVEPLQVNSMVKEILRLLEASVAKTATLKINLSKAVPAVLGDITQVSQVFMNLVTNASEAIGEEPGEITVTTGTLEATREDLEDAVGSESAVAGCYAFFEVSDTGCGMAPETRTRIFDPFFTTKFTGRGLGMAATLGIVRGHGGAIKLASEPGKGTTIRVLLPCCEDAAGTAAADTVASGTDALRSGGTILVVDDEEAVRTLTAEVLKDQGFNVRVARDGREALDIFQDDPDAIDLVLLDMTMPRMGGEETFLEMRKLRPDIRVLLSSGYNEEEATSHFAGRGLVGFIQKPYRPSELISTLSLCLTKPETASRKDAKAQS